MIGGAVGAYVLAAGPWEAVRPVVSAYLLVMGAVILWKALRRQPDRIEQPRHTRILGMVGGFLDAVGCGGWGPLVNTTVIGHGKTEMGREACRASVCQ